MSRTAKLYIYSPIRHHDVVLNELSTRAILPCIGISQGIIALTHVISTALHASVVQISLPEDGGIVSLRNIGIFLNYMAKQHGGRALHRERCGNFK
jgi:hypothetical protein